MFDRGFGKDTSGGNSAPTQKSYNGGQLRPNPEELQQAAAPEPEFPRRIALDSQWAPFWSCFGRHFEAPERFGQHLLSMVHLWLDFGGSGLAGRAVHWPWEKSVTSSHPPLPPAPTALVFQ